MAKLVIEQDFSNYDQQPRYYLWLKTPTSSKLIESFKSEEEVQKAFETYRRNYSEYTPKVIREEEI